MIGSENYHWILQECPICELQPTIFLGRRGGEAHRAGLGVECDVWRCGRCGLIFPNPMPVPVRGLGQHYALEPGHYFKDHDDERKVLWANALVLQAASVIGAKGRLLDIGAGRGEVLHAAKKVGWEAIGIELSPNFADYASQHSGAEVLCRPLQDCRFAEDSFDVVLLSAVLEHLYDPNEVLFEIARILRPGGALFVDVPNEAGLYFRVGNLYERLRGRNWVVNLAPTFSPFHIFGFTPKSLRALLSKNGFEVRRWHVFPGLSLLPAHGGMAGRLEQLASRVVHAVSKVGNLGTYIETWAVKV